MASMPSPGLSMPSSSKVGCIVHWLHSASKHTPAVMLCHGSQLNNANDTDCCMLAVTAFTNMLIRLLPVPRTMPLCIARQSSSHLQYFAHWQNTIYCGILMVYRWGGGVISSSSQCSFSEANGVACRSDLQLERVHHSSEPYLWNPSQKPEVHAS